MANPPRLLTPEELKALYAQLDALISEAKTLREQVASAMKELKTNPIWPERRRVPRPDHKK
jgi:DNA replication initiation complex subunit (GINS family)